MNDPLDAVEVKIERMQLPGRVRGNQFAHRASLPRTDFHQQLCASRGGRFARVQQSPDDIEPIFTGREGADRLVRELRRSVHLVELPWEPPVLSCAALHDTGVDAVVEAAGAHLQWCIGQGRPQWEARRGDARVRLYLDLVAERAREVARAGLSSELERALRSGDRTPHRAARDGS